MIIIRVELHSAMTGKVIELARGAICNDGRGTATKGDYYGRVTQGRGEHKDIDEIMNASPLRTGTVDNFPRKSMHVWNLVVRMLLSMGYK